MKRFFYFLLFSFLVLFFAFCGHKGPLLPPLIIFPQGVENFEVSQRGDFITLTWTNPTTYSDGSLLSEIKEIEIWKFEAQKEADEAQEEAPPDTISKEEFKKIAKLEITIKKDNFPDYQMKDDEGALKFEFSYKYTNFNRVHFALRIRDWKKRISEFSEILSIEPTIVPLPPQNLQSTLYKDRIEIKWEEPLKNIDNSSPSKVMGYNIYRIEEGGLLRRLNSALLRENEYSDREFLFEKVYYYFVRASSTESKPFAESSNSQMIEVAVEDIFAPAAPTGLLSLAGENFITLSWDENQEEDLLGYRVWRREEGEEDYVVLTPEPILGNSYVDSTVEKNRIYYYAITAQDKKENESERSESVSNVIKGVL